METKDKADELHVLVLSSLDTMKACLIHFQKRYDPC